MISKLIFAGYTGSKNQVRTRKKIEFVLKSIFFFEFEIEKKSSDTRYFKNQVEIDRGRVCLECQSIDLNFRNQVASKPNIHFLQNN